MPTLDYTWIVSAILYGVIIAMFFTGFRCIGILAFVFIWQCFTPTRAWYIDLPLMFSSIFVTEYIFTAASKIIKNSKFEFRS